MPSNESPRIAILGAGPIGLEAALYARYLGYPVELLERGAEAATHVQRWGHVEMFSPFGMNASPLGVAALEAQDPAWEAPGGNELLSGEEYRRRYLLPLAASDLIVDVLHCHTTVLGVARRDLLKREMPGDLRRSESPFRILTREANGRERDIEADVVLDTTGTFGNPNWLGQGGLPAIGELRAAEKIHYGLPDITGNDRNHYVGRHVLVVGAGYSAATTVVNLSRLAAQEPHPATRITWITRRERNDGPVPRIPRDRLPVRDALAAEANRLAAEANSPVAHLQRSEIKSVEYRRASEDFEVELAGLHSGNYVFDRIVANVGYRPDMQLIGELQAHWCYATEGPMKLAAELLSESSSDGAPVDCLQQMSHGPKSLQSPEPNLFILGSKSYGRSSHFLISTGLRQIRDVFTLVGEREDLDLYATFPQLT